jgi:pyruvate kinase
MRRAGERLGGVRTKIVATLGPACRGADGIRELAEAGADAFRLNFSHGSHADHDEALATVRRVSRELGRPLAVLQDLCGPKIRLGEVPGGSLAVQPGEIVELVAEEAAAGPRAFTMSHPHLLEELQPGSPVAVGDGDVLLRVISSGAGRARLEAELPGSIRTRQGLSLPHAHLSVRSLTDKDLADLDWTARQGAEGPDFVALSFVRSGEDMRLLRRELEARGIAAHVVAKIEKEQALHELDSILAESDAIMVARGDLALETDVARVPAIQKRVVAACHAAGRPVITATQMLASMERSPIPTRAEASDVFNAVLDGTDAVMLSGETAVGAHPALAVGTMSRILQQAEALLAERGGGLAGSHAGSGAVTPVTRAIVAAAATACADSGAALLVVGTHSGKTAIAISKRRQTTPTLAVALQARVASRLALYWGVVPLLAPAGDLAAALESAVTWARAEGLAAAGDRVVIVGGSGPASVIHDALLVRELA